MKRGLLGLAAFTLIGCSAALAEAPPWSYDDVNNKAFATEKAHRLAVLCGEDNDVVVYYSVPLALLEKALVDRKSPYLAIALDGDLSGLSGYSIKADPQDIEGMRYFAFRGKAAVDIARKMAKADDHIQVTVSTKNPATAGKKYPRYNSNVYPADGANEAIATLFEHCPQD